MGGLGGEGDNGVWLKTGVGRGVVYGRGVMGVEAGHRQFCRKRRKG